MLYRAMLEHGVFMEGCVLKSNIVNPGKKCPVPYSVDEIAQVGTQGDVAGGQARDCKGCHEGSAVDLGEARMAPRPTPLPAPTSTTPSKLTDAMRAFPRSKRRPHGTLHTQSDSARNFHVALTTSCLPQ